MDINDWDKEIKRQVSLSIQYDLKSILSNVECYEDNPAYESYKAKLETVIANSRDHIHPIGYIVKGARDRYLPDSSLYALYCLVSLGPWIDQQVKQYFSDYDYLEAMMLNALGDQILYEATNELYTMIKADMDAVNLYLTIRYEPGNSSIPISWQKEICDMMHQGFDLDIMVTEGFMMSPTKSLAYFYGVETEDCSLGIDHDCSVCDSRVCNNRKHIIKVRTNDEVKLIQAKKGENLLDVLRRHKLLVEAPCSGKGLCGKCKVQVPGHGFKIGTVEARFLTKEEINNDILLACFHPVDRNLEINQDDNQTAHEITTDYMSFKVKSAKYKESQPSLGIGIDIGTTTLAISLIDLVSHKVIDTEKVLNPQKSYGADVISRILYVTENPDHPLGTLIREILQKSMINLMNKGNFDFNQLREIVVSGNTTMIYLLLDIEPKPLAESPFTTVDMGLYHCSSERLWTLPLACQVTVLPWISAYVGGDIVSGIFATDLINQEKTILFIDIGTNGEMVLKSGDRILSASTAAGPAFEGANIRCGMGSIQGAICEITPKDTGYEFVVLGNGEPQGICGSALIDAIAILLENGCIEDTGYMEESYMFTKEIGIYPADIRQVQLAKAAISAGISVLLDEAGLSYEDVDYVYIAGGFGSHLNIKNAAAIGLIPMDLEAKVVVVGNTALAGSVRYLLENEGDQEIHKIISLCDYIELSMNLKFNTAYVDNMMFGGII